MSPFVMEIVPLEDAPRKLFALTLLAHIRTGPDGSREIVASGMHALLQRAAHTEAFAVIGSVGPETIGWAGLEVAQAPWPDPDMFISVYVHPTYRRRGYGSALVEAGLGFVHDTYPHLTPVCIPFDEAGFQTFRKAGFAFHPDKKLQRFA